MKTSTVLYVLPLFPAALAAPKPAVVPVISGPLASRDGISFIDCSECHYGFTELQNGFHACEASVQVYCTL